MAKFCTNCGKKLTDGQTCDCVKEVEVREEAIDLSGLFTKGITVIGNMFKKPIDTVTKYSKEDNFMLSIIYVVFAGISVGLFSLTVIKGIYTAIYGVSALGSMSSLLSASTPTIPYFKYFMITTLLSVGVYFLEALVLWLTVDKGMNKKLDYKKALNIIAPISIFTTVAFLLSIVGIYLSIYIVILLIMAAAIMNMTTIAISLKESLKLDGNKIPYIMVGMILITTIVIAIIIAIL